MDKDKLRSHTFSFKHILHVVDRVCLDKEQLPTFTLKSRPSAAFLNCDQVTGNFHVKVCL